MPGTIHLYQGEEAVSVRPSEGAEIPRFQRPIFAAGDFRIPYPLLQGEFAGLRKFRIGDYHVIFVLIDSNVLMLRIQPGRDAYGKRI